MMSTSVPENWGLQNSRRLSSQPGSTWIDRWIDGWFVIGGLNSPAERPGTCRRAESRTNRAGSSQIRHRRHLVSQHPNMAGLKRDLKGAGAGVMVEK